MIRFARVMNRIDRAFGRRPDCRDTDINRIGSRAGSLRKIPLRGAGRSGGARFREAHHSSLRTACSDVVPTVGGCFNKPQSAIIDNDACRRGSWIIQRGTGWIDLCAVIRKRGICHPQRFRLIVHPGIGPCSPPAVRIDRFVRRVTDQQMQMRTRRISCGATDTKHFTMRHKRTAWRGTRLDRD